MKFFKYIKHEIIPLKKGMVYVESTDNSLLVGNKAGRWKMGPDPHCTLLWLTGNSEVRSEAA